MLRALGKLRLLLSSTKEGLRREEMDGNHLATLGDRPFVGCQPCAPEPQGLTVPGTEPTPVAARPGADND